MSSEHRAPAREDPSEHAPEVSPWAPLALLGGLVIGFLAAYFLVWWGAIVVAAVIGMGVSAVLRGTPHRDAATGAIAGAAIGWLGMLLVAAFRGSIL